MDRISVKTLLRKQETRTATKGVPRKVASEQSRKAAVISRRAARKLPDEPGLVKHVRGIVSMARTDEPNSASTHFFILVGEGSHLDAKFAAFGRVRKGIEVADTINSAPLEGDKPVKPVRINRAVVAPCPK